MLVHLSVFFIQHVLRLQVLVTFTTCACSAVQSVVSDSLQKYGLQSARRHCAWGFPGKNTGMGCHFLLQGIFPTQGSNSHLLHLLHWQADSLPLSHLVGPLMLSLDAEKEPLPGEVKFLHFETGEIRIQHYP